MFKKIRTFCFLKFLINLLIKSIKSSDTYSIRSGVILSRCDTERFEVFGKFGFLLKS